MEIFHSIIHRLKEIRENSLHYSSDLLNRDKDNDGVIDRYDADERDSKVQEIGDLSNYNIQELNIKNLSKLGKLILGNSNYTSVVNKIDGVANEYLSELNIEKCTNINKLELDDFLKRTL